MFLTNLVPVRKESFLLTFFVFLLKLIPPSMLVKKESMRWYCLQVTQKWNNVSSYLLKEMERSGKGRYSGNNRQLGWPSESNSTVAEGFSVRSGVPVLSSGRRLQCSCWLGPSHTGWTPGWSSSSQDTRASPSSSVSPTLTWYRGKNKKWV